jgi:hypothetical protein
LLDTSSAIELIQSERAFFVWLVDNTTPKEELVQLIGIYEAKSTSDRKNALLVAGMFVRLMFRR